MLSIVWPVPVPERFTWSRTPTRKLIVPVKPEAGLTVTMPLASTVAVPWVAGMAVKAGLVASPQLTPTL